MGWLALLRSLDELLYELVSWLLFFPLTLWRSLVRPALMMNHADAETDEQEPQARRYLDSMSPPLFLFQGLLIAHVAELALVGPSPIVQSTRGASALVDSDTNLVIMRALLFSTFPLVNATWLLVRQRVTIDRDTLRPPFFAQCYAAAVFALLLSIGLTLMRLASPVPVVTGLALAAVGLVWFVVVEIRWFARHLRQSAVRSTVDAVGAIAVGLAIVYGVGSLFT